MDLKQLLVFKESTPIPFRVVHCGSVNKASKQFEYYRLYDTLAGRVVLTVGGDSKSNLGLSPEICTVVDVLHLYKIDMSDVVRVFNPEDYIGESTAREIEYAYKMHKPVIFSEPTSKVDTGSCNCCKCIIGYNPIVHWQMEELTCDFCTRVVCPFCKVGRVCLNCMEEYKNV